MFFSVERATGQGPPQGDSDDIPCKGTREYVFFSRAGDGIRTREYQLGRLMPYHLATPACRKLYHNSKTANRTHA